MGSEASWKQGSYEPKVGRDERRNESNMHESLLRHISFGVLTDPSLDFCLQDPTALLRRVPHFRPHFHSTLDADRSARRGL